MENEPADFCERENDVLAALASGPPSEQLAKHVASCGACAKAMEIASQLGALATSGMDDPLPSADFILWKSALRQRQAAGLLNDLVLRWSGWCAVAVMLLTIGAIASTTVHNLSRFGSALYIGLGTLTGILALSGVALGIWQRMDR